MNTAHGHPWGWRVTTYLWTKGVGSGALLVASGALLAGTDLGRLGSLVAPAVATSFTAATGLLLTSDLKRPERVLYIFTKANPTSWLFWGSVALAGYSAVAGAWLVGGAGGALGIVPRDAMEPLLDALACRRPARRPGWQLVTRRSCSPRRRAGTCGSPHSCCGTCSCRLPWPAPGCSLPPPLSSMWTGRQGASSRGSSSPPRPPTSGFSQPSTAGVIRPRQGEAASRMVTRGRYARLFGWGAVGLAALGAAVALPGLGGGRRWWPAAGGLIGQLGLLAYESVFVRAGQDVPLS